MLSRILFYILSLRQTTYISKRRDRCVDLILPNLLIRTLPHTKIPHFPLFKFLRKSFPYSYLKMHFMLLIFLPLLWVWFLAQTTFSCNLHKMSTLESWNWHVSLFFMQYFLAFQLDRFEGDLSWIDPELCHCLDQLSISISAIRQSLRNKRPLLLSTVSTRFQ